MDIANNGHGRADVDDVALPHQHLLRLLADFTQERLVEQLLAHELLDACVEVERRHPLASLCCC